MGLERQEPGRNVPGTMCRGLFTALQVSRAAQDAAYVSASVFAVRQESALLTLWTSGRSAHVQCSGVRHAHPRGNRLQRWCDLGLIIGLFGHGLLKTPRRVT